MKLKKLISAAAALTVTAMALSAVSSATLKEVPQTGIFKSGTGSWMPVLYSDGTFDASEKDVIDYGIDWTQIGTVEVTITPDEIDWFDGSFGGAIVLSSKSSENSTHNWNGKSFWGVIDEEHEIATLDDTAPVIFVPTGEYEYTGVMTVDDSNCVFDDAQLVQLAVQEWGQNMTDMVVLSMVVKDKDGNVMISFDENGNATVGSAAAASDADVAAETEAAAEETAAETEAAVEETAAETEAAVEETAAETEAAAEETTAAQTEAAPVETQAAAADTTAAAGNVAAATTSSKGSPDTGVEDVAAVAGLALLAGGAFVIAKKRK